MEESDCYSRINSTKSPVSGAGNVSEPRLMPEVGRVREACARRPVCLCSQSVGGASHMTHVGRLMHARLAVKCVMQNDGEFVGEPSIHSLKYRPGYFPAGTEENGE